MAIKKMEIGGIAETNDKIINNSPNHATQMKNKLQEAADVIQGLRYPKQSAQPAQSAQSAQLEQPAQSVQPTQSAQPAQ